MLKFTGFDGCIIGQSTVFNDSGESNIKIVYSGSLIISQLTADGMTFDEAYEYCEFNMEGAYVGKNTPIVVWDYDEEILNNEGE
jgi:hypothetical protein